MMRTYMYVYPGHEVKTDYLYYAMNLLVPKE